MGRRSVGGAGRVVANIPTAPQKPGEGKEESRRKIPEKPLNPKNLNSVLSLSFVKNASSFPPLLP
jgi:hypothetical protein